MNKAYEMHQLLYAISETRDLPSISRLGEQSLFVHQPDHGPSIPELPTQVKS